MNSGRGRVPVGHACTTSPPQHERARQSHHNRGWVCALRCARLQPDTLQEGVRYVRRNGHVLGPVVAQRHQPWLLHLAALENGLAFPGYLRQEMENCGRHGLCGAKRAICTTSRLLLQLTSLHRQRGM